MPRTGFSRRDLAISLAAAVPLAVRPSAASLTGVDWNYDAYVRATVASNRKVGLREDQFIQISDRRQAAVGRIRSYLEGKFGVADEKVIAAFSEVPREYFQYHYQNDVSMAVQSYESEAKPWAIGFGSALSDYLGQAYMTQIAAPGPSDTSLEIGTGSGFQTAVLSRIVRKAYSIEILEPLGERVKQIFAPLGYGNVELKVGDGFYGWPAATDGFDIIMITCAAQFVPPSLFDQLRPGGRIIVPIGQPFKRGQFLYIYTKDDQSKIFSRKDMGVYFIPMTGSMMSK